MKQLETDKAWAGREYGRKAISGQENNGEPLKKLKRDKNSGKQTRQHKATSRESGERNKVTLNC